MSTQKNPVKYDSYGWYDLNKTHKAEDSDNVVRILCRTTGAMDYVGVVGSKRCCANGLLYRKLDELSVAEPRHIADMLLPSKLDGYKDYIIPVKCVKKEPLSKFTSDWFFQHVLVYDKSVKSDVLIPLYFTLQFKFFLYNLVTNIILLLKTNIRPVMDRNQMFLSHVGGVIFTKYQMRGAVENWEHDRKELVDLIKWILNCHGNKSETLDVEIKELIQFLETSSSETVLQNLLKEIVFWTPEIRIQYIYHLTNRALSTERIISYMRFNEDAVHSNSRDAFLADGSDVWYQRILDSENGFLIYIYNKGNKHVDLYEHAHKYRTYHFDGRYHSFILLCGLIRLRDAYLHVGEYNFDEDIVKTDIEIQAMYQYLFPQHMAQFKNVLDKLTNFDVKKMVTNLLGGFQNEGSNS